MPLVMLDRPLGTHKGTVVYDMQDGCHYKHSEFQQMVGQLQYTMVYTLYTLYTLHMADGPGGGGGGAPL